LLADVVELGGLQGTPEAIMVAGGYFIPFMSNQTEQVVN